MLSNTLIFFLVFTISISSFAGFDQVANADHQPKFFICHVLSNGSDEVSIIKVDIHSVDRHIAHGDHFDCEMPPTDDDFDDDGLTDDKDNCPHVPNPDQADADGNGVGDACEDDATDTDGDGIPDNTDNCPTISNPDQADADGNGVGDACED
ncbi:MAG: thrombospondin type 3 repeat-containing protein, partial [Nitrosopumilaceae archaeon]